MNKKLKDIVDRYEKSGKIKDIGYDCFDFDKAKNELVRLADSLDLNDKLDVLKEVHEHFNQENYFVIKRKIMRKRSCKAFNEHCIVSSKADSDKRLNRTIIQIECLDKIRRDWDYSFPQRFSDKLSEEDFEAIDEFFNNLVDGLGEVIEDNPYTRLYVPKMQ